MRAVGHHLATVARDLSLFLGRDNLNLVPSQPESFKTLSCRRSNVIAVLSDAAREDEKIHTAQQSHVRPDCLSYRNRKDIQGKTGVRIIRAGAFFQPLDIALAGGKSEEATLMIDRKSTRLNSSHLGISYAVFCL